MIMRHVFIFMAFFPFLAQMAAALEFRLDGDRVTLAAKGDPLRDVLARFAHAGVQVKLDPQVTGRVTGAVQDEDVEDTLKVLLGSFGYVLIWDVVDGPLGRIPRLAEIQIFKPGRRKDVRPLPGVSENLQVAYGPSGGAPFAASELLVGFKAGTTMEQFKRLLAQIGGTLVASIPELGMYRVRLSPDTNIPALVEQLQHNPIVQAAEPNYIYDAPRPFPGIRDSAGARADVVPKKIVDGSLPVAVLDSGLTDIDELGDMVVASYDATNPERDVSDPVGHGTQMALIAAGAVQPMGLDLEPGDEGVPVVAIRAFDDNGRTSTFDINRSLAYALEQGARVANMSWGSETSSKFLADAIAYAQSKDLIVVAAVGNEPTGRPIYPAHYRGVLGVAATGPDGRPWKSSNYGDSVDLAAPGFARFPIGYKGPPGPYAGTSIASAYVSGVLTSYIAKHPKATVQETFAALRDALTDAGAKGRDPLYGFGALDASAVNRLLRSN